MNYASKNNGIQGLQQILKYTFGLVPIAAGADKFFNLLTHWDAYLPGYVADLLPFSPATFMMVVGLIEILAGALVLYKTTIGAYVVSAWLLLIALVLLSSGNHLDVAVRDIVMAISAYVLAKLTTLIQPVRES